MYFFSLNLGNFSRGRCEQPPELPITTNYLEGLLETKSYEEAKYTKKQWISSSWSRDKRVSLLLACSTFPPSLQWARGATAKWENLLENMHNFFHLRGEALQVAEEASASVPASRTLSPEELGLRWAVQVFRWLGPGGGQCVQFCRPPLISRGSDRWTIGRGLCKTSVEACSLCKMHGGKEVHTFLNWHHLMMNNMVWPSTWHSLLPILTFLKVLFVIYDKDSGLVQELKE